MAASSSTPLPLRNREGTPVDPVPFLVVSLLGFTTAFTYGPPYLLALGFTLGQALAAAAAVTGVVTVAAYHRYVWAIRPDLRAEVHPAYRLRRLFYGVLIAVVLAALLALPLLGR